MLRRSSIIAASCLTILAARAQAQEPFEEIGWRAPRI